MAATFDTLRTARRLKEAGAADLVAEAIAEAIGESREFDLLQLASKSDLAGVRLEVERVRAGMAALETRLIRWMIGVGIAAFVAIVGALSGVIWTATQVILHAGPH